MELDNMSHFESNPPGVMEKNNNLMIKMDRNRESKRLKMVKKMAKKMHRDPNDSDSLKEYSRRDPSSDRPLFKYPEGIYKRKGDRYIKDTKPQKNIVYN